MRSPPGLWAAAALTASLALGHPAIASELRVQPGAGSEYRLQVMSWWEIPFRTVVRQQYDFSCGSAALATLLTHHYGRPTSERSAFVAMWNVGDQAAIRKVGFSMLEMKRYLDALGYRVEGYRLPLEQLARLQRPSIVLLNLNGYKHFVVVKGIVNGKVLVGDPMVGLATYESKDFARYWNGIALAIVNPAGATRPGFNLARDWNPWSTAPLSESAYPAFAADITDHLPPTYQLTPQILFDVNTGTFQ